MARTAAAAGEGTLKRLFFFRFLGERWCSTFSTYIFRSFW